jgi:hypothetical protein
MDQESYTNYKSRKEALIKIITNHISGSRVYNELSLYKYGKSIDETIMNNLNIVCPDVEYELYKKRDIEDIDEWLMSYKNYVELLIGTYNERYEREFEKIRLKRELVKKSSELKMEDIKELPDELREKIYSYLPYEEKGRLIMKTKWDEMREELKKIKVEKLMEINKYIKSGKLRNIYNYKKETVKRIEVDKIYNYIGSAIQRTKPQILDFMEELIKTILNVKIRNKQERTKVLQIGYNIIVLLNICIKNNNAERVKKAQERVESKKLKRKDRENNKKKDKKKET